MEVAQRSGLIASYNNLENFWSLADDKNAAAITAAGSSEGVTQDTPSFEGFDNLVLQGQVYTRLRTMSETGTGDAIDLAAKMCGVGDVAGEPMKWSAQFWREFIDKFDHDWGSGQAAVDIFKKFWKKVLIMPDQGFATTLLAMDNLKCEPTERYVKGMTNVWSMHFGIQKPLPFAAHERALEASRQLKVAKASTLAPKRAREEEDEKAAAEDKKIAAMAEFAKTRRADEISGGMFLESTGLHSPSLKPMCSMSLEVGIRESPPPLTPCVVGLQTLRQAKLRRPLPRRHPPPCLPETRNGMPSSSSRRRWRSCLRRIALFCWRRSWKMKTVSRLACVSLACVWAGRVVVDVRCAGRVDECMLLRGGLLRGSLPLRRSLCGSGLMNVV